VHYMAIINNSIDQSIDVVVWAVQCIGFRV